MNSEHIHFQPHLSGDQPLVAAFASPYAIASGYDRIALAIDRPMLPGPVNRLRRACQGGLKVIPGRLQFNPVWQCTIDLHQPSRLALDILNDHCLQSQVSALLTYAEISHDLIFRRKSMALRYEPLVLQHLVVSRQRDLAQRFKSVNYFGRRSDKARSKRGRVLAVYSDKPSKLNTQLAGEPCVHFDYRITGSAKLAAVGIASVGDLREFDFARFWDSAVALYELPTKTEFGRILGGPGGAEVSGTALRKRGERFIDKCSIDGQFYMHNAVRHQPRLLRKLVRMPMDLLHLPAAGAGTSSY